MTETLRRCGNYCSRTSAECCCVSISSYAYPPAAMRSSTARSGVLPTTGSASTGRPKPNVGSVPSSHSFQREVLANAGRAIIYVTLGEPDEPIVRARAIENVVPIAVQTDHGFTVYNPTQYRQCSSYHTDRIAQIDRDRQTARSLLKRVPATAYRSPVSGGMFRT